MIKNTCQLASILLGESLDITLEALKNIQDAVDETLKNIKNSKTS